MKVLSLFDGVSCGMVALERANIVIEEYLSSEINIDAIKVSKENYSDIIQIGDITKVHYYQGILFTEKGMFDVGKIDLLIGGSPCQGFSFSGLQLNFNDPRSKLFFDFVRILNEIKKYNKDVLFLLENVKMKKASEEVITKELSVNPIQINSNLLSGQDRKRLYWCNWNVPQPEDKYIYMHDIIDQNRTWFKVLPWSLKKWGTKLKIDTLRKISDKKSFCITTNKTHCKNYYLNEDKTMMTKLDAFEAEALQTFPAGYTSCLPESKRFHAIGNAWTIDVVSHIFKHMPK